MGGTTKSTLPNLPYPPLNHSHCSTTSIEIQFRIPNNPAGILYAIASSMPIAYIQDSCQVYLDSHSYPPGYPPEARVIHQGGNL